MKIHKILAFVSALAICCSGLSTIQVKDTTNLIVSAEDEEYQYSGSCGENATYSFDEATSTLTISGTGDMDYTDCYEDLENGSMYYYIWSSYLNNVKTIVIEDGITSISYNAFGGYENDSITNVIIPNSVTSIDDYAFLGCQALTEVTIPSSVTSIGDVSLGYYFVDDVGTFKTEGFTIYGVKGSEAERYALDNEFTFIEIEETNTPTVDPYADFNFDVNNDGSIDVIDLIFLKKKLLGMI